MDSPLWNQREASIGVSVNEINSEINTATEMETPKLRKNSPMMPPIKAIGMKTTRSTEVKVRAARPISLRPVIAASFGS